MAGAGEGRRRGVLKLKALFNQVQARFYRCAGVGMQYTIVHRCLHHCPFISEQIDGVLHRLVIPHVAPLQVVSTCPAVV